MTDNIESTATFAALNRNIDIMIPPTGLKYKLSVAEKEKRKLVVKLGFDPTAPDLHLGHAVVLKKMRDFQDAGHDIVVIIGDFTAKIGDPTGRNSLRPPLSDEDIHANAETYVNQLSKILDVSKITVRRNSEWFSKTNFADVLKLVAKMTAAQILQREDFSNRFSNNVPIYLHELLYPIVQGQDSVEIKADIELGGSDQLFNCQVGRTLQETNGTPAQIIISMPLLVGLDGKEKMSKSKGNYVGLTDPPNQMYGKIMSIPDSLLANYLDLVTNYSVEEVAAIKQELADKKRHPMDVKKQIARNVVEQYHGMAEGTAASDYFANQFQNKEGDKKSYVLLDIDAAFAGADEIDLLTLCAAAQPHESKSQLRRLIRDGAVKIDEEKATDAAQKLSRNAGSIKLKIGKIGFYEFAKA